MLNAYQAHVSAITDPLSISVVGPVKVLENLKAHAESEGLPVTQVNLRGKVHNPENRNLSAELCRLCDAYPELRLPGSEYLQVPVRCNSTGVLIKPGTPLAHEVVTSTLVTRCEWYNLMTEVAKDLKEVPGANSAHAFAMFGTGRKNCVPAAPFEEIGLRLTKVDCMALMGSGQTTPANLGIEMYPKDAVAIVGAACRLPGASNLDELWELVSLGASKVKWLPESRLDGNLAYRVSLDSKRVGRQEWHGNFVDDADEFDNAFFGISPREALHMDPQQRLLLETAYQALDSCGYLRHHRREDFDNVGCFIGTTYTEYLENTTAYSATAYSATGTIRAFQNGKISYHFGWSGPSEAIDTACSSSLVAVHRAFRAIQAGECPMALAGGVNIITGIQNFLDLGKAGFLSPTGQCKPFDESGDGYCRADGVGLVVLKSLSQAVAEGDNILGVIPAVATNHGGLSPSITVPSSRAQIGLFSNVLKQSGLKARHVTYVEAHGTGTQVGDPIEMASIREVFGGDSKRCADETLYIGSLKANVGHSETAAGIGSLIKVLAMLQHTKMPPLAGFQKLNAKIPALEPDHLCIPRQVLPWDVGFRAAIVNSYGAAGSNSALICCEPPRLEEVHAIADKQVRTESGVCLHYPIFLSAASAESLRANADALSAYIRRTTSLPTASTHQDIGDVSYTLFERRRHHNVRWVGTSEGELSSLVQHFENGSNFDMKTFEVTPSSVRKSVVLAFSGQSKRNIQLDRSWYSWFPRLRLYIDKCDEILRGQGQPAILPVIFQSEPISDVVQLQTGTFAVQYACAKCWMDGGLEVAAIVGHSFGELTAMVVSGVLSLHDGLKLVASRAYLMREEWGSERGTMLAVHTTSDMAQEIIAAVKHVHFGTKSLEIACFNGPRSQVVVGSAAEVDLVEETMAQHERFRGIKHQRVNVTHGFHSLFVQPILGGLDAVAKSLTYNRHTVPLETCTEFPVEEIVPERITEHTRSPVYFGHAVARLEHRLGPCVWLEAGADSPIISMVKWAVNDAANHVFLPLKAADNKNAISLATAALWREGLSTSFWAFLTPKESGLKSVWLPPYQFQHKKYWLDWVDPVDQERRAASKDHGGTGETVTARLVTPLGSVTGFNQASAMQFAIHTATRRFTNIVSGHAIRGHPLCPASMYMECVVMATQTMSSEVSFQNLKFENISFQGALGLSHGRNVLLTTEETGQYLTWQFSFVSSRELSPDNKPGRPRSTTHAKGRFSVVSSSDLRLLERIMLSRMQQLMVDPRAEKLNASRAYSLFSRVVDYAPCLRGISSITILGSHAVAQVERPAVPVDTQGSTAAIVSDTVALDTFIQVLGLLINSSDACPHDEVYIATAIDSILLQDCNFGTCGSWTVYVMSSPVSAKGDFDVAGDILVFTSQGKLIMTGTGVQFTRYPISKLEKTLERSLEDRSAGDSTNTKSQVFIATHPEVEHATIGRTEHDEAIVELRTATTTSVHGPGPNRSPLVLDAILPASQPSHINGDFTPSSSSAEDEAKSESKTTSGEPASSLLSNTSHQPADRELVVKIRARLLELIFENCGMPLASVSDDTSIEEFGVDSLSMAELISSIEDSFGVHFDEDDFHPHTTIAHLLLYLQANVVHV